MRAECGLAGAGAAADVPAGAGAAAAVPAGAIAGVCPSAAAGVLAAVGRGAGGLPRAVLVPADHGHRRCGKVGVRRARAGSGGKVPQLVEQRRRRGPLPRAPGQAGGDDAVQLRGQPGQVGRLGREPHQHVHDRLSPVWSMPGGGERQSRAEGENVARHRRLPGIPCLLGGHVSRRADGPPGDCQLDALGGPGHAEVDHPGPVG